MVIVLANHTMENADKDGFINTGGVKSRPKYLFIQDVFDLSPQQMPPLRFWLIITGGLIVALSIYGLQLAGAESMKKLENYRLSMTASVVSALTINLFGIWCIFALMDKNVQYEFRVSKPISPPGTAKRKHPVAVGNDRGEVLLAWTEGTGWQKGGALAWQLFDANGQATDEKGRVEGVPVWSLVAAVPQADGRFVIFY